MSYGAKTELSLARSMADIEAMVRKAGFVNFAHGISDDVIVVGFSSAEGRQVRFVVPVKGAGDDLLEAMCSMAAKARGARPTSHAAAWEMHRKQLGRALWLTIKAKIECIEAGIETFEDAFMSQLSLPGGGTVGARVKVEIAQIYGGGREPPNLLPDYSEPQP